jgi:ABC-type glycerol-3-phosphate transport system substrate-binding protein
VNRTLDRQAETLASNFASGRLSRRSFVTGLIGLGLSAPAVASIVASVDPAYAQSSDLKGHMRFLVGPWSPQEKENQEKIAAGFAALHPNVTFEFRIYDWGSSSAEIQTSAATGAHDIYMTTESSYPSYAAADGFVDLASRVNDPSFADEKAKYLYWDRIASFGPKIMGLPISFHVENALFVNMDMVRAAGFDETFADSWDTFRECLAKMTKPGEVYGTVIGVQPYGEWYQAFRSAGGTFLTEDKSAPNVNLPEVIEVTERYASLFRDGIAAPQGAFNYDDSPAGFAAGKMATLGIDLAATTVMPKEVPFDWKLIPHPPGPKSRVNFNDLTFYMLNSKTQDQDLAWEVMKFWTNSENDAFWADNSGTYPTRADAADHGYGTNAAKQLGEALPAYTKYSVGLEDFPEWAQCESTSNAIIADCYGGKLTPEQAVANVEEMVKQEVGL